MISSIVVSQIAELPTALDFVQNQLISAKVDRRQIIRAQLNTEEVLVEFLEKSMAVTLVVHNLLGSVTIRMYAKGRPIHLGGLKSDLRGVDLNDAGPEAESVIRGLILRAQEKNMRVHWLHGINIVVLSVQKSHNQALYMTLAGMVLGVVLGLLLKLTLSQGAVDWITLNLLDTVSTMFINAIMLLVGPLVFFSMASCVAGFRDLAALGRISAKVLGLYLVTTCGALVISFAWFSLFRPGNPALMSAVVLSGSAGTEPVAISLRSTLVNVIPSNFFAAFHEADLIQILFVGILIGIAAQMLGEYTDSVQHILDAMNMLFSRAVTIITKFLPVAVFCSMAKMMMTIELDSLSSLLYISFTLIVAQLSVLVMYGFLLLFMSKLNPIQFIRRFFSTFVTAFSLCSSSAVMPMNMQTLNSMGVSSKVYSFSIPLGATVNMDGFSAFLLVCILSLVRVAELEISGNMMVTIILSILLISVGAPGVPGVGTMTLAMLLKQLGLPMELALLTLSVSAITEPLCTASNITGDAVVTTIVAKSEGLFDEEKFNAQKN